MLACGADKPGRFHRVHDLGAVFGAVQGGAGMVMGNGLGEATGFLEMIAQNPSGHADIGAGVIAHPAARGFGADLPAASQIGHPDGIDLPSTL